MYKFFRIAGLLAFYLAVMNLTSCKETEYILPPEVKILTPETGLAIAFGESVDIKAEVKNAPEGATYQWTVDGIKVSTGSVLHYEGNEAGNHTVKLVVTTERGSATDATSLLVARGEIDAAISIVDSRAPVIEYLDSLVLCANVYCREDYELEWIINDERVSKEVYFVFNALKEGTHNITLKVLNVNGKFVTDNIDIKVNVPQLAVTIDNPEFGFRTPVGEPLTLYADANRIGDVQYEWSVGGKVVSTEQNYTLPADGIDLVEVTLRVTDPTQTATTKATVDVHSPTQYGSYIVSKKDFHFVDYAGRVIKNVFTQANPDFVDPDFSGPSDYNEKYFVYEAAKTYDYSDPLIYKTEYSFSLIDLKTLHPVKDLKFVVEGFAGMTGYLAIIDDYLFYTVKITEDDRKGDVEDGVYMINISTGERKLVYSLEGITVKNMFSHNGRVFFFSDNEMTAIDGSTGEVLYTKKNNSYLTNMDQRETYTVANDKLYRFQSNSSYIICYDLTTGTQSMFLTEKRSPRLYVRNMCVYNDCIYTCNEGFLGSMPVESDLKKRPYSLLADLNDSNQYGTGYTMNAKTENLKIMPDGTTFVHWRGTTSYKSLVGIYSINNPKKMMGQLETERFNYIYQYIYRN